jgi:tetratricopeptide (TPR) repeat protein
MNSMKKTLLLFLLLFSFGAGALQLETVQLNKEGAQLLKQQSFLLAQEKFLKALSLDPFLDALHVNLGLALEGQGQVEKAVASYLTALKYSSSDQVRFVALFNLGQIYVKDKKIDEALSYYQMALDLKPDSIETKTNIELLVQQGGAGGKGSSDDKDKDQKDKKNQQGSGEEDQKKDDKKDDKGDKDKEQDKPKQYEKNKPQPKKFKSEDLTQGDVNKILGEIKQQEQKIRQDYNRKEVKEKPRDKDW